MANKPKTVYDLIMEPHLHQQRKHDLGEQYAQMCINRMTNEELLQAISDAIEVRIAEAGL